MEKRKEGFFFFFFFWGGGGGFCAGWVVLHVVAEKMKIYSYCHVIKNVYAQYDF